MTKVNIAGRMTYKVYNKLYTSMMSFSTKSVMKTVSEKLIELDNTEWYRELFNDRRNGQNETNCVHIDFINMMLKVRLMCFKIYLDLKDGLWLCFGPALSR